MNYCDIKDRDLSHLDVNRYDFARSRFKKTDDKILKFFEEDLYPKSNVKSANNIKPTDRIRFILNGFNENCRMQFISFVIEFGMDFPTVEAMWKEV